MLLTTATTARRTILFNVSSQRCATGKQARPFSCLIHTVAASVSKQKDSTSKVVEVESRTLAHGPCLGVIDAARMRQLHVGSSARLSQSDDDTTPAASASCHSIRGARESTPEADADNRSESLEAETGNEITSLSTAELIKELSPTARKWLSRGPTDLDGPGFVYMASLVGYEDGCWKIGYTQNCPEDFVTQCAKREGMPLELEADSHVSYRKNTEKIIHEHLRDHGILPPGGIGRTKLFVGKEVPEHFKRVVSIIKRVDLRGPRSRSK